MHGDLKSANVLLDGAGRAKVYVWGALDMIPIFSLGVPCVGYMKCVGGSDDPGAEEIKGL